MYEYKVIKVPASTIQRNHMEEDGWHLSLCSNQAMRIDDYVSF
ncbi:hypothetical protein SAMN04487866_10493 [Thermoactinomyces sp. DSM 45891]|nr:hypothetical protein [Thermoactinomyces sp. DSM 45892]SDY35595.1 hypothetical protein SAMN05444416_10421 [Thermoactinomyces sp. DSM 45892]SFX31490.1 hypothetical protein SAMN04487866_10493 [Thermoactinomyces sp. DSM 45891]